MFLAVLSGINIQNTLCVPTCTMCRIHVTIQICYNCQNPSLLSKVMIFISTSVKLNFSVYFGCATWSHWMTQIYLHLIEWQFLLCMKLYRLRIYNKHYIYITNLQILLINVIQVYLHPFCSYMFRFVLPVKSKSSKIITRIFAPLFCRYFWKS